MTLQAHPCAAEPAAAHAIHATHFERQPYIAYFSIERVFEAIRQSLPPDVIAERRTCRFQSSGIVRRLLNLLEARFHQGDVNHITGDVHYLALGLPRRNTILTIHDCVGLHYSTGLRWLASSWFWYRLPVRHVAAVTVISEFTRAEVIRHTGCPKDLVHVIYDPAPSGFTPSPKPFNSDMPVVLQVGTKEHNKNLVRVAEALHGVRCRLDIVGKLTGRQRQALEENHISYTQRQSLTDQEMIQRYRDCDLVVVASTYEGFGMPVIEANATGRPVVAGNVCSLPEVAGRAACLVDPFDSAPIRRGILRVMENASYRDRLVAEGFENAKRFDPALIAAQYAALYREILAGNAPPDHGDAA